MLAGLYGQSYGWSFSWPQAAFTVTSTGLPNTPTRTDHLANLSKTSDLVARIDRACGVERVNSGWRSAAVNAAVGGSSTSDHMTGRSADLQPKAGMTNRELAACLYAKRKKFPELDQVIWYTNKSHTHVGWRDNPRGQFKVKSGSYSAWVPTPEEVKKYAGWGLLAYAGIGVAVLGATGVALGAVAYTQRKSGRRRRNRPNLDYGERAAYMFSGVAVTGLSGLVAASGAAGYAGPQALEPVSTVGGGLVSTLGVGGIFGGLFMMAVGISGNKHLARDLWRVLPSS